MKYSEVTLPQIAEASPRKLGGKALTTYGRDVVGHARYIIVLEISLSPACLA